MGLVRDVLSQGVQFVKEEILPLRQDLMKAGILKPDGQAYDPKASLVDPLSYGQMGYGYKERYSILDYVKCRQITYADPIVAAVIQTRVNQVASFAIPQTDKYKVGFKIQMRDKEAEPAPGDKKKMKEIESFILHCGVPEDFEDTPEIKRRDNFEAFLRKTTRDSLTFDQVNFEVTPRNNGMPYQYRAIDASTIRLISDLKEQVEQRAGYNLQYDITNVMDLGSAKFFKEYQTKHPRYAQVINGVVRHIFDEWEMAFGVRNPRTDLFSQGYGFSEIEMLISTITSHMNAETYNRKFFSQGSAIKGILTFEGSVPPDQLEAFRRQWYQQVTGVNNAWRTPIMALGKDNKLNWQSLHSTNREMEFGKWLEYCIKTICGVFQMDPIEIGFDIAKQSSGQGGSGGLSSSNQIERIMYSQDKGLRPLLKHLQTLINDYIVYRIDPNFELEFVGLNVGDETSDIEKMEKQVKTFKTINEIRAEHDLEPLPPIEQMAQNAGDLVLDSGLLTFITQQAAAAQQAQAGQMDDQQNPDMAPEDNPDGEEEPDYESMSPEELQQELAKLQQEDAAKEAGVPKAGQPEGPAGKVGGPSQNRVAGKTSPGQQIPGKPGIPGKPVAKPGAAPGKPMPMPKAGAAPIAPQAPDAAKKKPFGKSLELEL